MIVRRSERVLVHGITGRQGSFWTERMIAYGTNIVGGVNPKKAGTTHCGVPVYGAASEAVADGDVDVAVTFIPPLAARDAALDAIGAGIGKLVLLTEHVPLHDLMDALATAREAGTEVVGPNTAGVVTPGECFVGFMPAFNERVFRPGTIGVISRSGSLGTLVCLDLVRGGLGMSAFIGIGGDPILGTTMRDALAALERDERTTGIVIVGEIGGAMEEEAAEAAGRCDKPVVAFIAGAAAPPGKRMGHAGAIVMGERGTYGAKRSALEAAGVTVVDTPTQVGVAMNGRLAPAS